MISFKERALGCLESKQEEHRIYRISESDLITLSDCPLCESVGYGRLVEVSLETGLMFFATDVCLSCGFVFRSVFPSRHWFRKGWNVIKTENPQRFNLDLERERAQRYERYYEILSNYCKLPANVLDIGSGYGAGAKVFKVKGCEVEVIEPEFDRAEYIQGTLGIMAC